MYKAGLAIGGGVDVCLLLSCVPTSAHAWQQDAALAAGAACVGLHT